MGDAEDLARKERRRRLIERLNEKEKLIGPQSPARLDQMSEEELAAEIERQRSLNAARGGGQSLQGPPRLVTRRRRSQVSSRVQDSI